VPQPTFDDAALWTSELAVTWALRHLPDFTVICTGMYWHPDAYELMRRAGQRVGLLLTETPYAVHHEAQYAGLVDVVWTNERTAVPMLQDLNPRTYYLPHAFNAEVHTATGQDLDVPAHDVVFVGTGFQERIEWLEAVDWTGIDLGLYGAWTLLTPDSPLQKYVRGGVTDNAYTAALYRRAKVGINLFRQSVGYGQDAQRITTSESLNPRSYELAACGCFHVSDFRAEVAEVFGELVPTFREPTELEALLRRWLADDHGRQRIAEQLPQAVTDHTWSTRARQMTAVIESVIGPRV
jgi:spore maturation protein CgeB